MKKEGDAGLSPVKRTMSVIRLREWEVEVGAGASPSFSAMLARDESVRRRRRARAAGTLGLFAVVALAAGVFGWRRGESQIRADRERLIEYHLESLRPEAP